MYKYCLYYLMILPIFFSCEEDIQPESQYYSGYITIGCDVGPYYLDLDSLKANCGSAEALPQMLEKLSLDSIYHRQLSPSNACSMDEMRDKLGSSTQFDFKLERGQSLLELSLSSNHTFTQIPLELDGTSLSDPTTDYPYLAGYEIDLNPGTVRLFALNIWVGGCLHDMIVWEAEE
ncbi:MAG: hypothetical protein R8P61_34200 [Bacteroidia bacterium]|nr:hypothetical protein [Bacteroidia bacterium]